MDCPCSIIGSESSILSGSDSILNGSLSSSTNSPLLSKIESQL